MNYNQIINSLNDKQQKYTQFDLPDPKNGEFLLCLFHIKPGKGLNILQAATEVAAESSTGTNFSVNTDGYKPKSCLDRLPLAAL